LPKGALETAAKKHGMSATDARVWWSRNRMWASFWMDVGRMRGRPKNGGRRQDIDRMLGNLALATQAEQEGESVHYFVLTVEKTQKGAHARQKAVHGDRRTLQEWIDAA
jgi:hypothetical protein